MNNDIHHYSPGRVKQILNKYYDCHLDNIWQGYKANRRQGYTEIYSLVENSTGKVLASHVTLKSFWRIFTEEGFPLKEGIEPNQGAIEFLEFVQSQKKY